MKSKQIRDLTFYLHRYIGLVVGLVLIIIGLTGSLLVFEKEINQFLLDQQFGKVIPHKAARCCGASARYCQNLLCRATRLETRETFQYT